MFILYIKNNDERKEKWNLIVDFFLQSSGTLGLPERSFWKPYFNEVNKNITYNRKEMFQVQGKF